MRWELNDLARRLDREPRGAMAIEGIIPAMPDSGSGLSTASHRMIEAIEALPEDEREVFDLVRIQGMTHTETASLLGVSPKTVQRRLDRGVRLLTEKLGDLRPDLTTDS